MSMILGYVRNMYIYIYIYIRLRAGEVRCFCLWDINEIIGAFLSSLFFSLYLYMYVCMIDCCAFENLGFRAGMYIDVYVYL